MNGLSSPSRRKSSVRRSGFTLLEILIVIAIIAILAAILFPVYARVRENARRTTCQNNLRQIGLGIAQYTQDYGEKLPARAYLGSQPQSWRDVLQPYLKSIQVFGCPSNSGNTETTDPAFNPNGPKRSYACNGVGYTKEYPPDGQAIGGTAPMGNKGFSASLSELNRPTQTLLVGESDPGWSYPYLSVTGSSGPLEDGQTLNLFRGHLGMVNFLFADGHVKALKPMATGTPINMWTIEDDQAAPQNLLDALGLWQTKVDGGKG